MTGENPAHHDMSTTPSPDPTRNKRDALHALPCSETRRRPAKIAPCPKSQHLFLPRPPNLIFSFLRVTRTYPVDSAPAAAYRPPDVNLEYRAVSPQTLRCNALLDGPDAVGRCLIGRQNHRASYSCSRRLGVSLPCFFAMGTSSNDHRMPSLAKTNGNASPLRQATILRWKPDISWSKDRGKNQPNPRRGGGHNNDNQLTLAEKRTAKRKT